MAIFIYKLPIKTDYVVKQHMFGQHPTAERVHSAVFGFERSQAAVDFDPKQARRRDW